MEKKQVFNPYLPLSEYIPDGEPHVFDGRVYVYGSHDKENGDDFCMLDYVTYSAPVDNLREWRYEGVIYNPSGDPLSKKYKYMYAPDVVRGNDGRYYLYYSMATRHPRECSYIMSVAVSNTPSGKFEFLGHVKNPDGTPLTDYLIFDPAVHNDNGTIRMYYGMWFDFWEDPSLSYEEKVERAYKMFPKTKEEIINTPGGIFGPVVVELENDMLTIKHKPYHILPTKFKGTDFEGHEFFEGSSLRKIGEKYYFIYASIRGHELCYATSDFPDKDFVFGGVIVSNGDVGFNGRLDKDKLMRVGNNHGSIESINGEWYVFYHRHTRKNEFSRQACAEKIKISRDGSIKQVEITSCGLNGAPLFARGVYPSAICCNLTNGHMPYGCGDGTPFPYITGEGSNYYIADIENGTTIGYKYFDFNNVTKIGILYRGNGTGKMLVRLDFCGESVAEAIVSPSADWQELSFDVDIKNGVFPLYFEYVGENKIEIMEFNFS